jgi:hypothetical protein
MQADARLDSSDKGAPERRIAFQQFASTWSDLDFQKQSRGIE